MSPFKFYDSFTKEALDLLSAEELEDVLRKYRIYKGKKKGIAGRVVYDGGNGSY